MPLLRSIPVPHFELPAFALALSVLLLVLLGDTLTGHHVLSPADVLYAQRAWRDADPAHPEPQNRLLMDPVLQFEPWLELCRRDIQQGRLPVWTDLAGLGAPLLANGQSAVFDPFHWIAFLGPMPWALAGMAFARLFTAGLGMFLLATAWGLGPWGRWFAGLAYPLCGFLIVWLLYPLSSVSCWLPWLLLTLERAPRVPSLVTFLSVSAVVGLVMVGGHVQTSAHVLLAGMLYFAARSWPDLRATTPAVAGGVVLGVMLAAPAWLPLGDYLAHSPVWTDRIADHGRPWTFRGVRWKEFATWFFPYIYGSHRDGHPNLARALGAENLNESAGAFAGLGTILWLAPLGALSSTSFAARRSLLALLVLGALASLRVPPVDNLLRAIPVLNVMDHRRLTLWVAFALVGLGAVGLDRLVEMHGSRRSSLVAAVWIALAVIPAASAFALPAFRDRIERRAEAHYLTTFDDPAEAHARAAGQIADLFDFLPRYGLACAGSLAATAILALSLSRGWVPTGVARSLVAALVMADLLAFGRGLNPAIPAADFRPPCPLIDVLSAEAPPPARILGLGQELPPNTLMRYGLADARNYDSIELGAALDWLEPIFEPDPDRPVRSSRREITWAGVSRASDRLRAAGVRAVVGDRPPPPGLFPRVLPVGSLFVGLWNDPLPRATVLPGGRLEADTKQVLTQHLIMPYCFDRSWRTTTPGASISPLADSPFFRVDFPAGARMVRLEYRPWSVRAGLAIGGLAAGLWAMAAGLAAAKNGSISLGAVPADALESTP